MNKANNPLNIKQPAPGQRWQGSEAEDDAGTAIFGNPAYGIRAAFISIARKWANNKCTIGAIVSDWAPADDHEGGDPSRPMNDPAAYTAYVCARCKIAAGFRLDAPETIPFHWCLIIQAMAYYETGEECPTPIIFNGAALALTYLAHVAP